MKIAKSSGQVSQSSSSDTHQFQISANGTAFQILSSGLYSNKQAAVLRELGCNAADAHVAAGISSTPISVTLPTENSRELVIRDFGLGMSHEQILSLYTTYFSSDKRDSNAFVGGLGLGSKSPFAYTNSFTITSIHQGVKRIYTCNIATDGAPTVTRLREEPTVETQGVEVRLLTKQQDMHLFMREATNVFQWFDTRPTFNVSIEFMRANAVGFSTPAYDIGSRYSSGHFIKMGNVAYPLQSNSLDLPASTLWPQLIANIPLTLKAPIGYLQVAASREALQYDPTTKKNLLQLYQQAYSDIARRIIAELADPKRTTVWAQETAAQEWVRKYLPYIDRKLVSALINQSSSSSQAQQTAAAMVKSEPRVPTIAGSLSNVGVYWYGTEVSGRKNVENGMVSVGKNIAAASMRQSFDTTIIVADDKHITEKVAHWRTERNLPAVLLVSPVTKKDLPEAQAHAENIAALLGGAPVMFLSKIALPGMVVAPSVKRDYVEIDDRIVEVWDLTTAKSTTMRFGDVPADMRYALVRDTTISKSAGVQYLESTPASAAVLPQRSLDHWACLFGYVQSQGQVWDGPKGAIVLRPVDVDRLKIAATGMPWFLPSLCQSLLSKTNKPFIDFADTLWPKDHAVHSYYGGVNKMHSGWLGDFGLALSQLPSKKAPHKELTALLEEAGILKSVLARQAPTSAAQESAWGGYYDLVRTLHTVYPGTEKTLRHPLPNSEQCKATVDQFPLLAHVSSKALFQSIGACENDAPLQQVLTLLRVCLNLPVGP